MEISAINTSSIAPTFTANLSPSIVPLDIASNALLPTSALDISNFSSNSFVSGIPARQHKDRLRQDVLVNQLPKIINRIRKLEK